VFIRGGLYAPANDAPFIDCNQNFVVCPGDPKMDSYQDQVFDMPCLHISVIGQIISNVDLLEDGVSRTFNIAVSEWIVDKIKPFTIKYVYYYYYYLLYCF